MKIAITYDKADILALVAEALKARGIKVKAGTGLEYKGALSIKFEVETEDEPVTLTPTPGPSFSAAPTYPNTPHTTPEEPEDDGDLSDILANSERLERNKRNKLEGNPGPTRNLGPHESYEFPKD